MGTIKNKEKNEILDLVFDIQSLRRDIWENCTFVETLINDSPEEFYYADNIGSLLDELLRKLREAFGVADQLVDIGLDCANTIKQKE